MSKPSRSLSELLAISREASNRTNSNKPEGPCVSCKRTLTILPLRYSVMSGLDRASVEKLAPVLPPHLGKRLAPSLAHSRYAIRSVREGYVYVFVKRMGKDYVCEATYRAHDSGLLEPVLPLYPGTPVGGALALGGWTLTVADPEDVDEARLLFTPDPLSAEMLERHLSINRDRDRLQKFDLRTLANSCGVFDDVITPSHVDSLVAEFLAVGDVAARAVLEKQAFPPFRSALAPGDVPRDMDSIYRNALERLMDGGGVAVVLDDPIGIVQELNAWRNDSIEMNLPWLKTVDAQGISNERRYVVAEALDDVKMAMELGYVEKAVEKAARQDRDAKGRAMMHEARFGTNYAKLERREPYDPERVKSQAESEKESAFKPYQDRLDWKAKERIQAEFARVDRKAQEEMDRRGDDHLAWLDSEMLEQALDVYDRHQPVWGQAFASQIALCLLGMNASSKGAAKLASWWSDTDISKRNLAWRALTRNNIDIAREARAAFATAKAAANGLTVDNLVTELGAASAWFQRVVDLLIKVDAAVQMAIVGGGARWFDPQRLPLTLSLFASLHEYMLKLLPVNATNRLLLSPMLGFVHAMLGEVTTRLRLSELAAAGLTANPNRVSGQVNSHIARVRNSVMREFQNTGKGIFHQLRGGTLLALLEAIILGVKISKMDEGEKEYLEFKAALLITTAATVELTALGVQMVADRYASSGVTGRGATVSLGGLRLLGGGLATVGGVMLGLIDYEDYKNFKEKKYTLLSAAYLARAVVSFGVAGLGALVSLSYSAPLLRLIFERHSWVIRSIEILGRPGVMPILLRLMGIGSLVVLGVSVAIVYLSPSKMEEWCWHSCLKKWKSDALLKPFKDQETELQKLYEALEEEL
ncbi:T6SS effector BTH_I2691 family protein [Pseudomonas sp. Marseille-P9899]|uniref:T6SS effector BTH_I2691 family protein n=1 Tax=Pseudomonas sp. Marseille-P9899 TaxID=2730401 RepID=UPI00158DC134|nr:T6SS effector BTH_I2691 family protein [Pseudomonas sp. Marseille-P9899]